MSCDKNDQKKDASDVTKDQQKEDDDMTPNERMEWLRERVRFPVVVRCFDSSPLFRYQIALIHLLFFFFPFHSFHSFHRVYWLKLRKSANANKSLRP